MARRVCSSALLIASGLIVAFFGDDAFASKWLDASGKHSVEAEFVGLEHGIVTLKKEDGSTINISLEKLSKEDQDRAKQLASGSDSGNPFVSSNPNLSSAKTTVIAPAAALTSGWDEIDQRLVFLMVRLANVETSLDAVEKAIAANSRQKSSSTAVAKRAEQGNDLMDRKGGGPVKWSDFYGRTAEKFFYHPVDSSTTYHTTTILTQQHSLPGQNPGSVDGSQGVPLSQRPPQFDYIYRANQDAKERAEKEAAELGNNIDLLLARRRSLEEEQSGLWCEIAFRAVSHYDLDRKPLYRFEPVSADADTAGRQHAEAMKAAAVFMRQALSIVNEAQKDQARTFGRIKSVVADSREQLGDSWLRQGIDSTGQNSYEGKFSALAKHLDDVASNLSDSYKVSIDGDRFKDEQRKDTFRGILQESLVNYAEIVLALNEVSGMLASQWNVKPDLEKPFAVSIDYLPTNSSQLSEAKDLQTLNLLDQVKLPDDIVSGNWVRTDEGIVSSGVDREILRLRYRPQSEYDFRITFTCVGDTKGVSQIVSFKHSSVEWCVGGWGNTRCAFHTVDGKGGFNNSTTYMSGIRSDHKYVDLVKVRNDSVSGFLDDLRISNLKTDYSNVATPMGLQVGSGTLGISTLNSKTIFHSIEVVPIDNIGTESTFDSTNGKAPASSPSPEGTKSNNSSPDVVLGKWTIARDENQKLSVFEFRPGGNFLYSRNGVIGKGTWKRDGDRIVFKAVNADGSVAIDKWLLIDSKTDQVLNVRVEGNRPYEWHLMSE